MSTLTDTAVAALNARLSGPFDGHAVFVFGEAGAIALDRDGARPARPDERGEVTLSASVETFRDIFDGRLAPMSAFMSGRLKIQGDMGLAVRLAGVL